MNLTPSIKVHLVSNCCESGTHHRDRQQKTAEKYHLPPSASPPPHDPPKMSPNGPPGAPFAHVFLFLLRTRFCRLCQIRIRIQCLFIYSIAKTWDVIHNTCPTIASTMDVGELGGPRVTCRVPKPTDRKKCTHPGF